jgi:hypothetical protein
MLLKRSFFLEQFYDSVVVLFGVYHPNAPLVLHHILDIVGHLKSHEDDEDLENVVAPMQAKFLQYLLTFLFCIPLYLYWILELK